MSEQSKPWVVRDVPAHTRRQVKLYAVEHDMTIAQALEAIVDSVSRRHDRRLLQTLLAMYRHVLKGDLEGAWLEAEVVRNMLGREPDTEEAKPSEAP